MLSYEHIKSLERQLYNAMNELHGVFSAACNDALQQQLNARAEKFAIVRRLYAYLSNGFYYEIAVTNLSLEFKLPESIIKNITAPVYRQYNATLRPYKIYAAHKMKQAGLNNKKIAQILNITLPTLTKYLTIKSALD